MGAKRVGRYLASVERATGSSATKSARATLAPTPAATMATPEYRDARYDLLMQVLHLFREYTSGCPMRLHGAG